MIVRLTPKFISRLLCHLLVATPDNMKDIMIEQDVLDRIQQLLTFKHWSLYKPAKQSDIPYSSLNNIFNRQTCPTMVTLEKICHGFNISLSEFFSFESNPLRNELLSDDEEELLNTYKELSVQNKKLLKAYLDGLCKR